MQVSAQLFIAWLKNIEPTERLLNIWLENTDKRSTDIEDEYYNGLLVWDNKSSIEPVVTKILNSWLEQSKYYSLNVLDNTRLCKLEFNPKHNPLERPKPKYKALDFDDNLLGEAFTLENALEIFYTRYAVFDKKAALEFIEKI